MGASSFMNARVGVPALPPSAARTLLSELTIALAPCVQMADKMFAERRPA
jgi:hypothetical protein